MPNSSRILRVVGTDNRKDPDNPLRVRVWKASPPTAFIDFLAALDRATAGLPASGAPGRPDGAIATVTPAELPENVAAVLGDYARKIPTEMLMLQQRSAQGPDPDVLVLKGLRLAYASETEDGRRLSEARVKDMTGGERLSARAPYATAPVEFVPTHKLVISGNHKPMISDTSHGMWRRVIVLPFAVKVPEADRDPDLPAKLQREGAGILNSAMRGLRDWRSGRGLRVPASIVTATATYRAEQDVLGEFLSDHCEQGSAHKAPRDALYLGYRDWCIANGHKPMSANRLTRELGERGFSHDRGRRSILGLRLT